ncbi:MAG: PASTA domain-containing protein [Candidatus Hydrogenedentes bacterium]|nr:PASTA domain-containing protein [Candidatus Hydrogenedentota bacterium]
MYALKSVFTGMLLVAVIATGLAVPGYAGAQDKIDPVALTYSAGPGGYILGAIRQSVLPGADGTAVVAIPVPGYRFVDWSDGSTAAVRLDTAGDAPLAVIANFSVGSADDAPAGTVYFVKLSGTGDGSSWENAGNLQAMVDQAQAGDEVWVAAGVYTSEASAVLTLKAGVAVYGGFAGTETVREQRDWRGNITMLFANDQRRGVVGADAARIDGFLIIRGYADYGGGMYNSEGTVIVTNCAFIQNMATEDGGGMYNSNVNTIVANCEFTKNTAFDDGGGMYNNFASPVVTNCIFLDNLAETGYGGGLYSNRNAPVVTNCTIYKNTAVLFGGGLFSQSASPVVTNCIIWGNVEMETPGKADVDGGTPVITFSCIEGGYAGEGNIDADPLFTDVAGIVSLREGSPCLDAGTATGAPGSDILGVARPQGGGHDMGAYEMDTTPPTVTIDQAEAQADPTNDSPVLFTVVFSEPIMGFETGDVSLSGTAGAGMGTVTGSGAVYDVAVTGMANPGTVIANIVAGVCQDAAGNLNGASTSTDNTVIYGSYTLTYLAGEGGAIEGDAEQTVFYSYDGTAVTAVPAEGYHFLRWSDGLTNNPRTDVDVFEDLTVTALFELNTYTLTYAAGPNGAIEGPSPQEVNHGSNGAPVTAVPEYGYHFVDWSDSRTDNPRTDANVTGPVSVTANFAINVYVLTYTAGPNGSVDGLSPQEVAHGGDGQPVTAIPATGYHFVDWSDAGTANPRTDIAVTGPIAVTANFAINTYTLTYGAGENGTLSGPSPQTVPYGGSGEAVTAVPAEGYHFVDWSDGGTANPRTDANITGDIRVTANFAINQYTLTYTAGLNGSVSGPSPQTVAHGASGEAVTAIPAAGYHFVQWNDGITANPRTDANVTGDIAVIAHFAQDPVEGEGEGEDILLAPDVVLLTLEEAGRRITDAGLVVGNIYQECSDEVPEGAVIEQAPVAGTIVEPLAPVDLVVSTGECPCSCGAFCSFNWGDLFLGLLAVIVLLVISLFALGGGGGFPK